MSNKKIELNENKEMLHLNQFLNEATNVGVYEKKALRAISDIEKAFKKLSDAMEDYVTHDDYGYDMTDQEVVDELNKIETAIEALDGAF